MRRPEAALTASAGTRELLRFAADADVWVAGRQVAASGPARELLLSGEALAELALRLGEDGAVEEAALLDGAGGLRRLLALRKLRRLGLVAPAGDAPPFTPPERLPRSGLPLHRALPADAPGTTQPVLLEGEPAEALAVLAARVAPGITWLPVSLRGPLPWAGPLFGPGQAACPACLALRLAGRREVARAARADPRARQLHRAAPPVRPNRAAALLRALDEALAGDPAALRGTILSAGRDGIGRHPAPLGVCGCPGGPALPLAAQVARLCDAVTGVVSPLREITGPGEPMRVASGAQSPLARWAGLPPPSLAALRVPVRTNACGGCAPDAAGARLAAAMEGIEGYAALWRGGRDGVARVAAFAELPAGSAVPPQALLGLGTAQQAEWAAALDPGLPRAWCAAQALDGTGDTVLVPLVLAFDGVPEPGAPLWDSNGLGAGPTRAHALRHALAELVERDAVAVWWHNALPRPRLPLPERDAAVAAHRRRGRAVALLDLTHDLGLPVRAALAWDEGTGGAITMGFAADPDAARADRRALAESCLRLPALDHWRRGGRGLGAELPAWFAGGGLATLPWLLAGPEAEAPPPAPMEAPDALAALLRALGAAGLRPLAVDMLRADVGIPVVKAFVPGLRHARNRFGPGRPFEVPVRMGWLDAPRAEAALLPFPEALW